MVLMEGGHLILFELPDLHPSPISLPLQELPELTCCTLAESASADMHASSHAVTLEQLKVCLLSGSAAIPDKLHLNAISYAERFRNM